MTAAARGGGKEEGRRATEYMVRAQAQVRNFFFLLPFLLSEGRRRYLGRAPWQTMANDDDDGGRKAPTTNDDNNGSRITPRQTARTGDVWNIPGFEMTINGERKRTSWRWERHHLERCTTTRTATPEVCNASHHLKRQLCQTKMATLGVWNAPTTTDVQPIQSDISNRLGIPDGAYPPMFLAYRIPAEIFFIARSMQPAEIFFTNMHASGEHCRNIL
jgi:hypothetical protein